MFFLPLLLGLGAIHVLHYQLFNYMKEDHHSYRTNFCGYRKKA